MGHRISRILTYPLHLCRRAEPGLHLWMRKTATPAVGSTWSGTCSPVYFALRMHDGLCFLPHTPSGPCTDAEYDHDAGLEHLERRGVVGRKGGREKEAAREKQRQIREYQKHTSALVSLVGRAVSLVFRDVSLVLSGQ